MWEHAFLQDNGRKPEKKDIAQNAEIGINIPNYKLLNISYTLI